MENMHTPPSWLRTAEMNYSQRRAEFVEDHYQVNDTDSVPITDARYHLCISEMLRETRLKKELRDKGLAYEAILPTTLFRKLVEKMELYTFKHVDAQGKTRACVKEFIEDRTQSQSTNQLYFPSVVWYIALVSVMIHSIAWGTSLLTAQLLIAIYLYKKNTVRLDILFSETDYFFVTLFTPGIIAVRVKDLWVDRSHMKRLLWPDRTDDLIAQLSQEVSIRFSKPPKSLRERFSAWESEGMHLYTVADERTFKVGLSTEQITDFIVEWDPMNCYDKYGFTVIAGQWGSAPSELTFMNELIDDHFRSLSLAKFANN